MDSTHTFHGTKKPVIIAVIAGVVLLLIGSLVLFGGQFVGKARADVVGADLQVLTPVPEGGFAADSTIEVAVVVNPGENYKTNPLEIVLEFDDGEAQIGPLVGVGLYDRTGEQVPGWEFKQKSGEPHKIRGYSVTGDHIVGLYTIKPLSFRLGVDSEVELGISSITSSYATDENPFTENNLESIIVNEDSGSGDSTGSDDTGSGSDDGSTSTGSDDSGDGSDGGDLPADQTSDDEEDSTSSSDDTGDTGTDDTGSTDSTDTGSTTGTTTETTSTTGRATDTGATLQTCTEGQALINNVCTTVISQIRNVLESQDSTTVQIRNVASLLRQYFGGEANPTIPKTVRNARGGASGTSTGSTSGGTGSSTGGTSSSTGDSTKSDTSGSSTGSTTGDSTGSSGTTTGDSSGSSTGSTDSSTGSGDSTASGSDDSTASSGDSTSGAEECDAECFNLAAQTCSPASYGVVDFVQNLEGLEQTSTIDYTIHGVGDDDLCDVTIDVTSISAHITDGLRSVLLAQGQTNEQIDLLQAQFELYSLFSGKSATCHVATAELAPMVAGWISDVVGEGINPMVLVGDVGSDCEGPLRDTVTALGGGTS